MAPASAITTASYANSEIVLSGLKHPTILDISGNWLYFSEYDDVASVSWLERFNIVTTDVEVLVRIRGAYFRHAAVSGRWLYYVIYVMDGGIHQIYRLDLYMGFSTLLYTTDNMITGVDVDALGNFYFAECGWPPGTPPVKLMKINLVGMITCLWSESTGRISDVVVARSGTDVYFSYANKAAYIMRYRNGKVDVLLVRSSDNAGTVAYLHMGPMGNLFYFYRQRSELGAPSQWAYLELGFFSQVVWPWPLRSELTLTILLSEQISDRSVWVWAPSGCFLGAFEPTLDAFTTIIFWPDATANIIWVKGPTGEWEVLVEASFTELLPFVVSRSGDVYYSMYESGVIVRIIR